mgnify:CR=1 FL=1
MTLGGIFGVSAGRRGACRSAGWRRPKEVARCAIAPLLTVLACLIWSGAAHAVIVEPTETRSLTIDRASCQGGATDADRCSDLVTVAAEMWEAYHGAGTFGTFETWFRFGDFTVDNTASQTEDYTTTYTLAESVGGGGTNWGIDSTVLVETDPVLRIEFVVEICLAVVGENIDAVSEVIE